ncbi:unnamed protein product [Parnassius apollo]|uniref:MICOS complex subunit n=1 Tax=Parnassius apollo TaxID=110799 RepID=A0A8S3Y7X9_PARAO|nr:unnamed protein product [Parnassius apollo]
MQTKYMYNTDLMNKRCKSHDQILNSNNESKISKSKFCYGDLYTIGKIWLFALKSALLGFKVCLIPVVKADSSSKPPKKPPPMKYKDLPLYQSPHYEYKEFIASKSKCPEADVKLMHRFLLPYVTMCRKEVQNKTCQMTRTVKEIYNNARTSLSETKKDFKASMRDSENLSVRKAVVLTGAGTGYLLAVGKGIPRRIFMTAAGAAMGGALCFPKETDEAFRTFAYYSGKTAVRLYNWSCGKELTLRERLPCQEDVPASTNQIISQCPQKR